MGFHAVARSGSSASRLTSPELAVQKKAAACRQAQACGTAALEVRRAVESTTRVTDNRCLIDASPTMSEEFEVRAPYEDRLDEAAAREPRGMAGQLAVMTALLATAGAVFSYMAGATQADAARAKNDASIKKIEAFNQWNFYQARSNKQHLSELGLRLSDAAGKPYFDSEVKRYAAEKVPIKLAAEQLETEAVRFDKASEVLMHQHHRWAQATTALQIAIAMTAIALLTRKRWLTKAVYAMSGLGLIVGALAYFHL